MILCGTSMPSALLSQLEPVSSRSNAHVQAAKQRASRERRSEEEAAQRMIDEHFPGFSPVETDGICHHGLTLRQVLLDHVRSHRSSKQRLGKGRIAELREAYCSEENLLKQLPRGDKSVAPTPELVSALHMADHPNPAKRRREPLWSLLSTSSALTRRDFLAILRSLIPLNPYGAATRHHLLECLRLLQLPALKKHDRGELLLLSPIWDKALAADLAAHLHKGKARETWWDANTTKLGGLREHEAIDRLIVGNKTLKDAFADIQTVCKTSMVAQKMFANAACIMGKENFKETLTEEIMALEMNFSELRLQNFKARSTQTHSRDVRWMLWLLGRGFWVSPSASFQGFFRSS